MSDARGTEIHEVVRILVADDHELMRKGVVQAVEAHPEIDVVAEAGDGAEALRKIRGLKPVVALLDVRMGEPDGLGVLSALVREGLPTRVLFFSAYVDGALIHEALAEGAAGFLSKEASGDQLADALIRVARGETVVASNLRGDVYDQIRRRRRQDLSPLSHRETEILERIASGASRSEIAAELHLSESTVKTNLQRVYEKLGVSGQGAAVAEGFRRGLLR